MSVVDQCLEAARRKVLPWWRLCRSSHANVAVLSSFALIPIIVAIGGTLDYARANVVRGALQNAIDAAVLAGAAGDNSQSEAAIVFAAQIADIEGDIGTPTFSVNDDGQFVGKIDATVKNYFLPVIGISQFAVSAGAVAAPSEGSNKVCLLVTDPRSSNALIVNNNVTLTAPDCEIDVLSTGTNAAYINSGGTMSVANLCIASNSATINGTKPENLTLGCTTASDPFAGTLPTPTVGNCDYSWGNYSGGTVTLSPGVYCGLNFYNSPKVTFRPGLYIIKGGNWNFSSGTFSGAGVTFYFADSSTWQVNKGVSMTFSAPTSGTYSGILMYEPSGLSNSYANINANHAWSGLIYLPSRIATFTYGSSVEAEELTMVFYRLTIETLNWNISSAGKSISSASSSAKGGAYLIR